MTEAADHLRNDNEMEKNPTFKRLLPYGQTESLMAKEESSSRSENISGPVMKEKAATLAGAGRQWAGCMHEPRGT